MGRLLSWKKGNFRFFFVLSFVLLFIVGILIFKQCLNKTYYFKSDLPQYYLSAVKYYKEHLFASAIKETRRILKIDPNYKDAYVLLGDIYVDIGLYHEAIRQYLKATEIDSMSKDAHCKLALAYWQIGDYAHSGRVFETILRTIDPNDIALKHNLASCYLNQSLFRMAMEKYREILKLDPNYAIAYYNIGIIYFNYYQDYQKAIAEWTKALEINPNMEEATKAKVFIKNARIKLEEESSAEGNKD